MYFMIYGYNSYESVAKWMFYIDYYDMKTIVLSNNNNTLIEPFFI